MKRLTLTHIIHRDVMAERRQRQLARTANCSAFGRKLVRTTRPDGQVVMVGVERQDEQGAYRAKHWKKAA